MSKSGGHKRHKSSAHGAPRPRTNDRAIYLGFIIIGAALVGIAFLLSTGSGSLTGWCTVGYVAIFLWLMNASAIGVYRGRSLPTWQQSLARLPLRTAGFGTKGGKPVEAAHNAPAAKTVIIVSVIVSVVVLLGLAVWLVPDVRALVGG